MLIFWNNLERFLFRDLSSSKGNLLEIERRVHKVVDFGGSCREQPQSLRFGEHDIAFLWFASAIAGSKALIGSMIAFTD